MQAVTLADCLTTIKKYLLPIFDSSTSIAAVASSKSKADDISKTLTEAGYDVELKTLETGPAEGSEDESMEGSDGSDSGSEGSDEAMGRP